MPARQWGTHCSVFLENLEILEPLEWVWGTSLGLPKCSESPPLGHSDGQKTAEDGLTRVGSGREDTENTQHVGTKNTSIGT